MTREEILDILMKRGYPPRVADTVSRELMDISKELCPLLNSWLLNGSEPDYIVDSFSIHDLMSERKMKYPAALLTVDWILKDPPTAKAVITSRKR